MARKRRGSKELFSTSFFDTITCGLGGAMLLLFVFAAMIGAKGNASFKVNVAEAAKNDYTLIAEFTPNSSISTEESRLCKKSQKGWMCRNNEQNNIGQVKITFNNEGNQPVTCSFTLISAISVRKFSPQCFHDKTNFEVKLEKTDKMGFIWVE